MITFLTLLAGATFPQTAATTPDTLLVGTEWLAERLAEPNLVILHVGRDDEEYREGHIPGSRFISDRSLTEGRDGGVYDVRPVADLVDTFEHTGLRDGARVIIYGPPLRAARTFYTLEYLGFDGRVSLLDGGLEKWRAEGRSLTTDRPPTTRGSVTARRNDAILVDADWVAANMNDDAYALVDARPEEQYGAGHIEGARNLYYEEALTDEEIPVLEDRETLQRIFVGAGVEPGQQVVTYCAIGMRASFMYFVARYLGYDVSMYDGSIHDWSMVRGLPVVPSR